MRIVNLSSGGDPFLSELVLKLFRERFYNEVDRFIVNYNNHANVPQPVVSEFLSHVSTDPKIDIIYHPLGIGNGTPIKEGVLIAPENSLIMLLEDDGFIFTPGKVDENFKRIESGELDALGSPRASCGAEVTEAMVAKYGIDISGYGDRGVNYWPNFFFCKRYDLLNTDLNFGSKIFLQEEYYKELDHTFVYDNYGDTFVWADIQMRYHGVRFGDIPQFHCSPTEIADKQNGLQNWHQGQKPYWLHGGSLSAGWGGYLSGLVPDVSTLGAKMEIETRVAWWKMAADIVDGYDEFKTSYRLGIANLIRNAQLDEKRIEQKYTLYRDLINL